MKVGDLVRLPGNGYDYRYWWADQIGLIVGIEDEHQKPEYRTARIIVAPGRYTKFGMNFLELISESR